MDCPTWNYSEVGLPIRKEQLAKENPAIYLAFVDDWELRGNGSGDIEDIQFRPMRELINIYNNYGIKGSFNVEVLQQLTFREFENNHPELKVLADKWDAIVCETLQQGHDIQLHIHPQWTNAKFENGSWQLTSDWSILNYSEEEAYAILERAKFYFETLLRPIKEEYKCLSFRSGAWCLAPSPFLLEMLVRLGIVYDISIVGGVHYDTKNIKLDYRRCEETFSPFYPSLKDARKVSHREESIICVPTHHFIYPGHMILKRDLKRLVNAIMRRLKPSQKISKPKASGNAELNYEEWIKTEAKPSFSKKLITAAKTYLFGDHCISDISALDYSKLSFMINDIRKKVRKRNHTPIPIILENHTKDIKDFSDIKKFISVISQSEDIECLTLTELAQKLKNGNFFIRKKDS